MADQAGLANQIFISYRREDSAAITGRIYDRLVQQFGREAIFKDVDSMPLGVNYRKRLDVIVSECAVVLVVIGDRWIDRLQDPRDFVRIEVESALRRSIPVVPLLVQDAPLPTEESLPESLRELPDCNGLTIGHDPHFHDDLTRLIARLQNILAVNPKTNAPRRIIFGARPGETQVRQANHDLFPEETKGPGAAEAWPEAAPSPTREEKPKAPPKVYKATRKTYAAALSLGLLAVGIAMAAGIMVEVVIIPALMPDDSGDNGRLTFVIAELMMAYGLGVTGFLFGRRRAPVARKLVPWMAAVPCLFNLWFVLEALRSDDDGEPARLALTVVVILLLMPLMPLFAYLGLHLGALRSSLTKGS
jgi:hypothetical protein